jgi:hypothetical protein
MRQAPFLRVRSQGYGGVGRVGNGGAGGRGCCGEVREGRVPEAGVEVVGKGGLWEGRRRVSVRLRGVWGMLGDRC